MTAKRKQNDAAPVAAGESDAVPEGTGPLEDRPLGISLLIWLYWFWAGAVALVFLGFAIGEGPVMMSGRAVPRADALASVLPVLLPMGLAVIGGALALSLQRSWARPAVLLPVALAAFGPALSGVGTSVLDAVIGTVVVLALLALLGWYLYVRPAVKAYFARLKTGGAGAGA